MPIPHHNRCRAISPFFNLYAVLFLVGGAIVSAAEAEHSCRKTYAWSTLRSLPGSGRA